MHSRQKGFSTAVIIAVIALVGIGLTGLAVLKSGKDKTPVSESNQPKPGAADPVTGFSDPKKGAHFESATPAHGSTHAGVPNNVVIDFNFDLAANSSIKIEKDGKDFGIGGTQVDAGKLAMRRAMDSNAPNGLYTVTYDGCWPDKSCHEGFFQFVIDRGLMSTYEDLRGKSEVTVKLTDIKFKPKNILVSKGTAITWINDDSAEHYINTDSHPAHTHESGLNSKALIKGASYSYAFNESGSYPYHCSAHAMDMTGNIVVDL